MGNLNRQHCGVRFAITGLLVSLAALIPTNLRAAPPAQRIDLSSRLELFADGYLIDQLTGGARLAQHRPVARDVAMVTDAPWEGNACHYRTVLKDGDTYRMYYLGLQYDMTGDESAARLSNPHPAYLCLAESKDGLTWTRPELGLVEFNGSKKNNIVLDNDALMIAGIRLSEAGVVPFKDPNPSCPPDARYKAVAIARLPADTTRRGNHGLAALKSPDGIHWSLMSEKLVITDGNFDSQNLAFWDPLRREYRAYHRTTNRGLRGIQTETSQDFLTWTKPVWVGYGDAPAQALYTNQVQPYYRAPHLFVGFPMRYMDRGWSDAMESLPQLRDRRMRSAVRPRYGTVTTDALFMCSRDGVIFKRWDEAFIRPTGDNWTYADNSVGLGMIQTPSNIPGGVDEISFYVTEGYWRGKSLNVRRFSLRVDGFVSINTPLGGGECITRPLSFSGKTLTLNCATSAAGSIRVEIQDEAGQSIPGYLLEDCPEIFCDSLNYVVRWKDRKDVESLAGKTVRLRFALKDADLYAIQFQ